MAAIAYILMFFVLYGILLVVTKMYSTHKQSRSWLVASTCGCWQV